MNGRQKNGAASSSSSSSSAKEAKSLFVFANDKAGMKGVDKERVAKIINDSSKNSAYYAKMKRQDEINNKKVAEMKTKIRLLSKSARSASSQRVEALVEQLERERNLTQIWVVVDMVRFIQFFFIRYFFLIF